MKVWAGLLAVLLLAGCVGWPVAEKPDANAYYVSLKGDDSHDGTLQHPFKTLQRAQQAVRGDSRRGLEPLSVIMCSGTYQLAEPLRFEPQDSGSDGAVVTWRARKGDTVVIRSAEAAAPLETLFLLNGDRCAGMPLEYLTLSDIIFEGAEYALRTQDVTNGLLENLTCQSCVLELGDGSREMIVNRCRWIGEMKTYCLRVSGEDNRILSCEMSGQNGRGTGMRLDGRGNVVRFCDVSGMACGVTVAAPCNVVENSQFSRCEQAVTADGNAAGTVVRANVFSAISGEAVNCSNREEVLVEP